MLKCVRGLDKDFTEIFGGSWLQVIENTKPEYATDFGGGEEGGPDFRVT